MWKFEPPSKMNVSPSYDVILVGAGISGLYACREILKANPTLRVAVCEKYKALGGRTSTFHKGAWHWEAGAGRIHKSHAHVLGLLREYGLTWVPIGSAANYKPTGGTIEPNPFESVHVPHFLKPLEALKQSELRSHTLQTVCEKVYGKAKTRDIFAPFPYRAEVNTLRADLGLQSFLEGEMRGHEGYGIVKEGFSALVDALVQDIEARGAVLLRRHTLQSFTAGPGKATDLTFRYGSKQDGYGTIVLRAEQAAILTLCRCHVAALPQFKGHPLLKKVIGRPLLRIYMAFEASPKKPVWFANMTRLVLPELPRYIIPIDPKAGTIMISYTDAEDTKTYHTILETKGDAALEARVLADVRAALPEYDIPKPLFTKAHDWITGASYWTPGDYDVAAESRKALRPFKAYPGLYMCGESWSLRQAWVEGALEHTMDLLKTLTLS